MRRTPLSPLKISANEWNQIQAPSSTSGVREDRIPPKPRYVPATGLNMTGETITAGSPVFYCNYNTGGTVGAYTSRPMGYQGYFELWHAFWAMNSTELSLYETQDNRIHQVGVALENIEVDSVGQFAIGGIVGVKGLSGNQWYARPTKKTANYKTEITGDRWGFRILAEYEDWLVINLDAYFAGPLIAKTKPAGLATGGMGLVTVQNASSTGWTGAGTTTDYPAWTELSPIAGDSLVLLEPIIDRWYAIKLC